MNAFALWEEPLPADEREQLIGRVVETIARRGLQTPALLLLEMHKPLAFVASQGIVAATPLLGPLIGLDRMQSVGRLLAEPGGIEELISRIEASAVLADEAATRAQKTDGA